MDNIIQFPTVIEGSSEGSSESLSCAFSATPEQMIAASFQMVLQLQASMNALAGLVSQVFMLLDQSGTPEEVAKEARERYLEMRRAELKDLYEKTEKCFP